MWDLIIALNTIKLDKTEKSERKFEVNRFKIQLETLEMTFMALVRGFLLHNQTLYKNNYRNLTLKCI